MKILFIIGNGFDINIGIESRYSDFYKYYKSIPAPSKTIEKLKEAISDDYKNWSDMELALGRYTENIKSKKEFDEIYIDLVDNLADYLQVQEEKFDYNKLDQKKLFRHLAFPERVLPELDKNTIS